MFWEPRIWIRRKTMTRKMKTAPTAAVAIDQRRKARGIEAQKKPDHM